MASPSTAERINREVADITKRTGGYIPPWRMTQLMGIAEKVMKIINKEDGLATYSEILLVLDIVRDTITRTTGQKPEN